MLISGVVILIVGFLAGQVARRLGCPPLVGMIGAGILVGPEGADILSQVVLAGAPDLRTVAVMIILMRAGLGLDRDKLLQQGSVALRLGFLPALCEALVIAAAARLIFQLNGLSSLLLGCVLSAESPAVIVPGMLRLKRLGWGVTKGIPDTILTGSALSDVWVLLMFSFLLNSFDGDQGQTLLLPGESTVSVITLLPFQIALQIGLGLLVGYGVARILVLGLVQQQWTHHLVHDTILAASLTLVVVIGAEAFPVYSGYCAAMSTGFYLIQLNLPLARRLRGGFNNLWIVAEIVLFVLMGASIQLSMLEFVLAPGLVVLALGTLVGRMIGWWLSTLRSNWTWKERLFLLPANSAKATVQAAIGAIPLTVGLEGGDLILAMSALSILITAPLGAWAIPLLAPQLLEKGEVDPTKVAVEGQLNLIAAVDTSEIAESVLGKVADLARRSEATVLIVHVVPDINFTDLSIQLLQERIQAKLTDIQYQFQLQPLVGSISHTLLTIAEHNQASMLIMGKRGHQPWIPRLMGSVSQAVVEASPIPVLIVEDGEQPPH